MPFLRSSVVTVVTDVGAAHVPCHKANGDILSKYPSSTLLSAKCVKNTIVSLLGFTALKTGIASLNKPYSNDYLNKNFNLNMKIYIIMSKQEYMLQMMKK